MFNKIWNTWRHGVRLYIALAITLVTLEVWWWAGVAYGGSILFATRLEEVYAWLSIGLVSLAVMIGPAYHIWPRLPGKVIMYDARRLIGIGGAWFASLHVGIVYMALFKTADLFELPGAYRRSFALGIVALLILLAMAFTSFDRALRDLGIWWFRLHRLVYVALLLGLFHALTIGVHATQWPALILLTILAVLLLSMQIYLVLIRKPRPSRWQLLAIGFSAVLLIAAFDYGYSQKLGYNPLEGIASAHVLKQDHGISAVLHIPPEDAPVAGVPTTLNVSFADTKNAFNLANCNCQVILKLDETVVQTTAITLVSQNANMQGRSTVKFPQAGAYEIAVRGTAKNGSFPEFALEYPVHVSAAGKAAQSGSKGMSVILIAAGSLIIIGLLAYLIIAGGGRYASSSVDKPRKTDTP